MSFQTPLVSHEVPRLSSPAAANPTSLVQLNEDAGAGERVAVLSFLREQEDLQRCMSECDSLVESLHLLHKHQLFKGFLHDETTTALKRTKVRENGPDARFFLAAPNPERAKRANGAGRARPPAALNLNGLPAQGCFLCRAGQFWQQRTLQFGYRLKLDGDEYVASCNPFPLAKRHVTVALAAHAPQRWSDCADLQHVVRSLVELAQALPGWVAFFNGSPSAGCSIPAHRHFQAIEIEPPQMPFPLQSAAVRAQGRERSGAVHLAGGVDYPTTVFRFSGDPESVVGACVEFASRWRALSNCNSENLIALVENGSVVCYFAPRDEFAWAPNLAGKIASLEILGEFPLTAEKEVQALGEGAMSFETFWTALRAIDPCAATELARELSFTLSCGLLTPGPRMESGAASSREQRRISPCPN